MYLFGDIRGFSAVEVFQYQDGGIRFAQLLYFFVQKLMLQTDFYFLLDIFSEGISDSSVCSSAHPFNERSLRA